MGFLGVKDNKPELKKEFLNEKRGIYLVKSIDGMEMDKLCIYIQD